MGIINTTKGEMDESLLERKDDVFEDDNERTVTTEYYHNGELVHRSAHVTLRKAGPVAVALIGKMC